MSVASQKHVKTSDHEHRCALAGGGSVMRVSPPPACTESGIPDVILSKGLRFDRACNYPNTLQRAYLHNFTCLARFSC